MKAFIKDIQYYVPLRIITNEKLVNEFPEWSISKISSKIGIEERHVSNEDETASDLAFLAAQNLFNKGNIKRENIDFILFCTQSPDYFLPTSACILQERLHLSTHCGALDYNLGCSGYVYGLALAKGLVTAGIAQNVLLLTGETYSKYIHPKDKGNRTIFGDAGTATVISNEGIAEIMEFCLGTDGSGARNLIVKNGGMRNRILNNEVIYDENGNPLSDDHLYMNGSEIFTFTLDRIPSLVNEILLKNNLEKENIDLFIFHQANKYMLDFLRKKIKIEKDKFLVNFSLFGNTVSNTVPIALKLALRSQQIKKGNKVLLAGFGVGYSWGGCTIQF